MDRRVARRWIGAFIVTAFALGAVMIVPVIAVGFDEMAIPTARQAHLPADIDIAHTEMACGSGGCSLVLTLDPQNLKDNHRQVLLGMHRGCRAVSWVDRRYVCTYVRSDESSFEVDLSFKRWFGL